MNLDRTGMVDVIDDSETRYLLLHWMDRTLQEQDIKQRTVTRSIVAKLLAVSTIDAMRNATVKFVTLNDCDTGKSQSEWQQLGCSAAEKDDETLQQFHGVRQCW
mgnify:FL=1